MKYLIPSIFVLAACSNPHYPSTDKNLNKLEPYQPKDSITFPHQKHVDLEIDCKYCHNAKTENNRTELTKNVCANCHKTISGNNDSIQ